MPKKFEEILTNPLVIGALALFFIKKGVADPLLENLGLKESAESKETKAAENVAAQQALNPNFYKTNLPATILTQAAADKYGKLIYDAMGIFNDDEAQVYGVFRAMKNKCQVSYLADRFYITYKKDLLSFLKDYFNTSEMAAVYNIINKLLVK
jgi:hypothetical protein